MDKNLFMNKIKLPISVMAIISSTDYLPKTVRSMLKTLELISPQFGCYIICPRNEFELSSLGINQINLSIDCDYSFWILKNLKDYIQSDYTLIQQWDSCVINPNSWTDNFISYDYIGAPWRTNNASSIVGNGGFSLRSGAFIEACGSKDVINTIPIGKFILGNEDYHACFTCGNILHKKYGINFAPESVAMRFSVERFGPEGFDPNDLSTYKSFGFHGDFNRAGMNFINNI